MITVLSWSSASHWLVHFGGSKNTTPRGHHSHTITRMNIQNVQNLQGLVRVITSIINIVWRMRLVDILLKIYSLLACFGYVAFSVQVGNSHGKISLQSYFLFPLCWRMRSIRPASRDCRSSFGGT